MVSFVTCTLVPVTPLRLFFETSFDLVPVPDLDLTSELKSGRKNGKQARHIPMEGSMVDRSIGTHSAYSKSSQLPPLRDQIQIMLTMLILRIVKSSWRCWHLFTAQCSFLDTYTRPPENSPMSAIFLRLGKFSPQIQGISRHKMKKSENACSDDEVTKKSS